MALPLLKIWRICDNSQQTNSIKTHITHQSNQTQPGNAIILIFKKLPSASMLALFGSAALSLWQFFGEPSINTDGVIYVRAAKAFLDEGIAGSLKIYGWPFYSILIALVSKLGLSLTQAAASLNVLFFATLAWAFVATTAILYPARRATHYLAAAVILFLPYLNSLRGSFFRDNGHVTCMLLSLLALLHYANSGRSRALLAWALFSIAAILFRPEAALLLPAGIIALGINAQRKKATLLWLAAVLGGAVACILFLQYQAPNSRVSDFLTWINYFFSEFSSTFSRKARLLEKTVLSTFSDSGTAALIASLLASLISVFIATLTPFHAIALWLQRKFDTNIATTSKRILVAYFIATLIPPTVFVAFAFFVSQRYVLAPTLLLLLLVAPRLPAAYASVGSRPLRIGLATLATLFFIISSYRNLLIETELKDAGNWLAQQPGPVWTNSMSIAYYASTQQSARTVTLQNLPMADIDLSAADADRFAIVVANRDADQIPHLLKTLSGVEEKRFSGGGRFVVIIKR